jgi:2,3-dihydroxybiphenyl 1,2-dioxygenase
MTMAHPHTGLEIAYAGVEVADPDGLSAMLLDVVGLIPGSSASPDVRTFRNDAAAHRILVTEGPFDDCNLLGFEAEDDATFEATIERLASLGFAVVEADAEAAARRHSARLATATLPWGTGFELVTGLERGPEAALPLVAGGFQTQGVGFGHAVFALTDLTDAERFLIDGLGMRQSDWIETELMEGVELEVRFYHCNQRHHSVALAKVPFDFGKRLHHLQFEANERDDVGAAFDRAWDAGLDIANNLGVHDNEGAFSFYATTPAGFLIEVGTGTKTISSPWNDNRRYDRLSRWGHQPVPRPAEAVDGSTD